MDLAALAARGESVWHRLGLRALGVGWRDDGLGFPDVGEGAIWWRPPQRPA
jgi:hypothetical protein